MSSGYDWSNAKLPLEVYRRVYKEMLFGFSLVPISSNSLLQHDRCRRIGDDVSLDVAANLKLKNVFHRVSSGSFDIVNADKYQLVLACEKNKDCWKNLGGMLERVVKHDKRGASQTEEFFVQLFEGDMGIVDFFNQFAIHCSKLRSFSVSVSSFALYGLSCAFMDSTLGAFGQHLVHLDWNVKERDLNGHLFQYLMDMPLLETLKVTTDYTVYVLPPGKTDIGCIPRLEYIEFFVMGRRSLRFFEVFGRLSMPRLKVVALRGRSAGMDFNPVFMKHGSLLQSLEVSIPMPDMERVLAFCPIIEDLIFDVMKCTDIVMDHDRVRRIGLRGLSAVEVATPRVVFRLESVLVYVSAKCYFPALETISLLGTDISFLRNTVWNRPIATLWIKWLPIFVEKGIRLEDGLGNEINHETLIGEGDEFL